MEKEWQTKTGMGKERIVRLVTLSDPNIEISDIWRTEEVKEDDDHVQLDMKNQKLNVPFMKQIYSTLESKEFKGASQTELASELGLTKLTSRTLVRNLIKSKTVSTYLDDVGRQRTTKFVSRKFHAQSSLKKQLDKEISKIKEYSRLVETKKVKGKSNGGTGKAKNIENNVVNGERCIEPSNSIEIIASSNGVDNVNLEIIPHDAKPENQVEAIKSVNEVVITELTNEPDASIRKDVENDNFKNQKFIKANSIIRKYKLLKNQKRPRYILPKKHNDESNLEKIQKDKEEKKETIQADVSNDKEVPNDKNTQVVDSDFYKTIETKLIVQKPECKKRSQKLPVVGFMENVYNSDNKQANVSYRLLRRANLIIASVKEYKIIEDTQKLIKVLIRFENSVNFHFCNLLISFL